MDKYRLLIPLLLFTALLIFTSSAITIHTDSSLSWHGNSEKAAEGIPLCHEGVHEPCFLPRDVGDQNISVRPDGRILFAEGITEEARKEAIRKLLSNGYSAHEIAKGCVYEDDLGWPRVPDRINAIVDITTDCLPETEPYLRGYVIQGNGH